MILIIVIYILFVDKILNDSVGTHSRWFGSNDTMTAIALQIVVSWQLRSILSSLASHIEHQFKLDKSCIGFNDVFR